MAVVAAHAKAVEAVKPSGERAQDVHTVEGITGLRLVVSKTGSKQWHWRYVNPVGKRRRVKLGDYPDMSLAKAKAEVGFQAERMRREGVDPFGGPARGVGAVEGPDTVQGLLDGFVAFMEAQVADGRMSERTVESRRRMFAMDELATLRTLKPSDVRPEHIARALDPWERRGALVALNRVQLALSAAMEWALARRLHGVEGNPVAELPRRHSETPRERILDAEEIAELWADAPGDRLTQAALRLLLLTGQRSGEVRRMEWKHLDLNAQLWTMPKGFRKRTKADRGRPSASHVVHLSRPALEILERLKRSAKHAVVFPGRTGKPRDRQSLARAAARLQEERDEPWTPHDLRRTVRSGLAELNVDPVVAEKILGHALPPILRTYDTSPQLEARAEALECWAEYVVGLPRT